MVLLSTPRLTLRRFHSDDAAALAAYRSDPEVARYQSWAAPVSVESAQTLVAEFADGDPQRPGCFQYGVECEHVLIGDIGVNLHENGMQAEIGFTLAPAYQGRGYATEAVRSVVEYPFAGQGLHRVSAECDARNLRSADCWPESVSGTKAAAAPIHGSRANGPTTSSSAYSQINGERLVRKHGLSCRCAGIAAHTWRVGSPLCGGV